MKKFRKFLSLALVLLMVLSVTNVSGITLLGEREAIEENIEAIEVEDDALDNGAVEELVGDTGVDSLDDSGDDFGSDSIANSPGIRQIQAENKEGLSGNIEEIGKDPGKEENEESLEELELGPEVDGVRVFASSYGFDGFVDDGIVAEMPTHGVPVEMQLWDGLTDADKEKFIRVGDTIAIEKVDKDGKPLAGVEFTLYKAEPSVANTSDGDDTDIIEKATTDSEGKAYFRYMDFGKVWLKETKTLPSLELNKDAFTFFVDDGTRFLGEVSAAQLFTGDEIATDIGLTAGTRMAGTNEAGWLKFKTADNKLIYVAKKPFRHSISWENIAEVGAVYEKGKTVDGEALGIRDTSINVVQNASVSKNGKTYDVRLLKAYNDSVDVDRNDDNKFGNYAKTGGSEWNKYIVAVSKDGRGAKSAIKSDMVDSNNKIFAGYNWFSELGGWSKSDGTPGESSSDYYGAGSWCQNTGYDKVPSKVYLALRGGSYVTNGAANSSSNYSDGRYAYRGFRPALILAP